MGLSVKGIGTWGWPALTVVLVVSFFGLLLSACLTHAGEQNDQVKLVRAASAAPTISPGETLSIDPTAVVPRSKRCPYPAEWQLRLDDELVANGRLSKSGTSVLFNLGARGPEQTEALARLWSPSRSTSIAAGRVIATLVISADAPDSCPRILRSGLVNLRLYHPYLLLWGALQFLVFALAIAVLAVRTAMLRDAGGRWSLSRTQLCLWFVLITGGYVFVWLMTWRWSGVVNADALALLGINSATALGAATIAKGEAAVASKPLSKRFFADILSEPNGKNPSISILRLAAATWTLILAAIFVSAVLGELAFPTFGLTLLALTGITNAAYVTAKAIRE